MKITFLGAGKMAIALAKGLMDQRVVADDSVSAFDIAEEARSAFTTATGAPAHAAASSALAGCDVIFLAVKPQVVSTVLSQIEADIPPTAVVISIAAGVSLSALEKALPANQRVIRVMPNTPSLVGAGAACFSLGTHANEADATTVEKLMAAVGTVAAVPESALDAVTGLSGSGPAYGFQMIEALSDGGVRVGLPRPLATQLAAQTLLGAAKMVLETGEHPGALKDAVTSPGGTTIAGVHALEAGGLRAALIDAVVAATHRSVELSN